MAKKIYERNSTTLIDLKSISFSSIIYLRYMVPNSLARLILPQCQRLETFNCKCKVVLYSSHSNEVQMQQSSQKEPHMQP